VSKLFIVTGEEEFLIERYCVNIISSYLSDQTFKYELPDDLDSYLNESQSNTIDGSSRVFWIKFKKVSKIPIVPVGEDDILIVEAGSKKISDKSAYEIKHFPKLKSYKNKNEILDFIVKEGESRKISLKRIAPALFVNVGTSLRKLSSEIDKLAQIVPEGGTVGPDLIRSVTCFASVFTPREVVDAICEGKVQKALAFYQKLQEKDETGWILAYVMRHVANQIRTDYLYDSGVVIGDIPSEIGMNSYVFTKTHGAWIQRWSLRSLRSSLSELCRIDVLHKRGSDVRCALERIIISLSLEAGDVSK